MIASTCQHFCFGGATASLKNLHKTFHDCKRLSTLPFWGRYSKPEKLTYHVPWLQAIGNTSVLGGATASLKNWRIRFHDFKRLSTFPFRGRYSKPAKLRYHVPWLQALVNASVLGALQQAWKIEISRSMIASNWQHFRFKGRYSKPEKLTFDVPWLQALVNISVLGELQQAWKTDIWLEALSTLPFWGRYCKPEKLTYHVPWLQELVDTSVLGALQQGGIFLNLLDFFAFLKSRQVIRACWFHSQVSVYVVSWLLVL